MRFLELGCKSSSQFVTLGRPRLLSCSPPPLASPVLPLPGGTSRCRCAKAGRPFAKYAGRPPRDGIVVVVIVHAAPGGWSFFSGWRVRQAPSRISETKADEGCHVVRPWCEMEGLLVSTASNHRRKPHHIDPRTRSSLCTAESRAMWVIADLACADPPVSQQWVVWMVTSATGRVISPCVVNER